MQSMRGGVGVCVCVCLCVPLPHRFFPVAGDFFGILRFDGLDPMLAWAMGSTTGHTTIALRDELTNELYITESTVNDVYWPTNGIQKTPWKTWFNQTITAGFNAVHAPVSACCRCRSC